MGVSMKVIVIGLLMALASPVTAFSADYAPEGVIETIILESVSEGLEGMIAVAEVIRNRTNDPRWPDSYTAVVYQPWQFSCWNEDAEDWRVKRYNREATPQMIQRAMRAWHESQWTSLTKGATLYHADYVTPNWDWSKTERIVKIGKHIFYRS